MNDRTMFVQVITGIRMPRPSGRPWTRPRRVIADKAYSTRAIRTYLRRRGSAGGRPPTFDPIAYRRRNIVGRCFNRLKHYRAITTRYDKTALSYQGWLDLATTLMWL